MEGAVRVDMCYTYINDRREPGERRKHGKKKKKKICADTHLCIGDYWDDIVNNRNGTYD